MTYSVNVFKDNQYNCVGTTHDKDKAISYAKDLSMLFDRVSVYNENDKVREYDSEV